MYRFISQIVVFLLLTFGIFNSAIAQNEFITIWKTDNPGTSANDEITIPGTGTYQIAYQEVGNPTNMGFILQADDTETIDFPNPGTYRIEITGNFTRIEFAGGGDAQKLLSIEQWGNIQWTTMASAFEGCTNLTYNATDVPNFSQVTSISRMFYECFAFNGEVGIWDVSTVTLMVETFHNAKVFNQDLSNWNVSNVMNMRGLFQDALIFNGNISNWNTGQVTNLQNTFEGALAFNQDLGTWDVSQVGSFVGIFRGAVSFNQDISGWQTVNATNMNRAFDGATNFNHNLGNWDLSNVTTCTNMLKNSGLSLGNYDQTLAGWATQSLNSGLSLGADGLKYCESVAARNTLTNTFSWVIMGDTKSCPFRTTWKTDNSGTSNNDQILIPGSGTYDIEWQEIGNTNNNGSATTTGNHTLTFPNSGTFQVDIFGGFNQIQFNNGGDKEKLLTIESWGDIVWANFAQAFYGCTNLTYNATDAPNLVNVFDCREMFRSCTNFNGDLNNWTTKSVGIMEGMFRDAANFNGDISSWGVGNVKNMRFMFAGTSFNQDISSWTVGNVTNMGSMFENNPAFNQNIGGWNVSKVKFMGFMFKNAVAFNQDLSNWTTTDLEKTVSTFEGATNFNQSLANWDISKVAEMDNMFDNSGLSRRNYDATLLSWATQNVQPNVTLGALNLQYCDAETARTTLMNATNNWTISGNTKVCPFVTTWDSSLAGNANNIRLPVGGSFDYYFEKTDDATVNGTGSGTGTTEVIFPQAGIYLVEISGSFTQFRMDNISLAEKKELLTIESWGTTTWVTMNNAFRDSENMTYNATDTPDLSLVTDFRGMFRNCQSFNGDIGNWDMSAATTLKNMFRKSPLFNQNLDDWNVGNVTDMQEMFREATAFNQPLNSWNVSKVEDMFGMFWEATSFNQDLQDWNTLDVLNFQFMFFGATAFNGDISSWNTGKCVSFSSMFQNAVAFNQDISNWNTSDAESMSDMFNSAANFNQNLGNWNIETVEYMTDMLSNSGLSLENYEAALTGWAEQNVENNVELGATGLRYCYAETARNILTNAPNNWIISGDSQYCPFITTWDSTLGGTNTNIRVPIQGNFNYYWEKVNDPSVNGSGNDNGTTTFNFPSPGIYRLELTGNFDYIRFLLVNPPDSREILSVEQWGKINWTSFAQAFLGCINLQVNATDAPDLSNVTSLNSIFNGCTNFNGDIGHWDVSNVTAMGNCFKDCPNFNQDLSNWDISNSQIFLGMFQNATSFNQDISNWDLSGVFNTESMFSGATSFDQDLGDWDVSNSFHKTNMLDNCGMSAENYDNTLVGWANQSFASNQTIGVAGLDYCTSETARNTLIAAGWNFVGDQLYCSNFLPIELLSFRAFLENKNVKLVWQTASEIDNSHFEIEHSLDGKEFRKIGEISGAGTTNDIQFYDFLHERPLQGWNYYRLKQVDFDEAFEYSKVLVVDFNEVQKEQALHIYPNPTNNIIYIQLSDSQKIENISLLNVNGKIVLQINSSDRQIDLSDLPNGAYFLEIKTKTSTYRECIIKQ